MEAIVHTYPKIKECQVVGFPDNRLGEKTAACIIPRDSSQGITREEIVDFMADKVVKYLIPDMVVKFEDFPRTASGKVQKFKLKERVIEKHEREKKPEKT
jgi:fatty-acyl-CoA synthase